MKKLYLLMGGPGSGKTSVMQKLQSSVISHFSIGAMYRELSLKNSELGNEIKSYIDNALVVPISIAQQVIERFINTGKEIIVIDGYPRNMEQLNMLNNAIKGKAELCLVIELIIDKQEALKRISARARGTDDNPQLFEERIRVYELEIQEIRTYYQSLNKYLSIDNNSSFSETVNKLKAILNA